jgi:hypothetical protein
VRLCCKTSLDRILRLHPRPKKILFSSSKNVLGDDFAPVKLCVVRVEEEKLEHKANHCSICCTNRECVGFDSKRTRPISLYVLMRGRREYLSFVDSSETLHYPDLKIAVFLEVTPFGWIDRYRRSENPRLSLMQGRAVPSTILHEVTPQKMFVMALSAVSTPHLTCYYLRSMVTAKLSLCTS